MKLHDLYYFKHISVAVVDCGDHYRTVVRDRGESGGQALLLDGVHVEGTRRQAKRAARVFLTYITKGVRT